MLEQTKIIILVIVLNVAYGWMPPDRCNQPHFRLGRSTPQLLRAPVTANITETALNQNKDLNEKYRDAKFFGVPISGYLPGQIGFYKYYKYAPNNCKFHTYDPHLLASVSCQDGIACKLTHGVTTTKTYTSSAGYNWGVKVSTKFSLKKVFEIGGEVSYGETYTCTFTASRATTDTVECAVGTDNGGKTLQLYNVQSDMECQFSTVTMYPDLRNNTNRKSDSYPFLANEEVATLRENAIIRDIEMFLPNLDKMSSQQYEKLWNKFPLWNPYTDLMCDRTYCTDKVHAMIWFKEESSDPGPKRVIPFTNENGDSIFQYACRLN